MPLSSRSTALAALAARDLTATLSIMWPGVLSMIALYATHQVVLTHRLAGPLYRIRVTMVGMVSGVLPASIRLRKKDLTENERKRESRKAADG